MRKDMKHVIIDRPRTGGDGGKSVPPKGTKKRLQKTPLDELPVHESNSARRIYGYDCKQLNENLSPLRRWLNKQIGRNWDDVWSEICEGLSVHNATTAHVRDHADKYVEKNCTINEDNVICDSKGIPLGVSFWHRTWYVDPRDNTLQSIGPKRRWRQEKRKKNWVEGKDDNHRYYLLNDVWYEIVLAPFPKNAPTYYKVYDLVIAAQRKGKKPYCGSYCYECENRYGKPYYAKTKRQLNKKEIKKLDLWNYRAA